MHASAALLRLANPGPRIDLIRAVGSEIARRDAAETEQSPEVKQLVRELCRAKAVRPT